MTNERDRIGEIQDRLRRIETRLTRYMQERGFETRVQPCKWDNDTAEVQVPSMDVRLRDVLAIIPKQEDRVVEIRHQGQLVASLDDFSLKSYARTCPEDYPNIKQT